MERRVALVAEVSTAVIQAFIFDMDGVLVDNSRYHLLAWREYVTRNKIEVPPEIDLETMMGKRNPEIFRELLGDKITPEEARRRGDELETLYRELYRPHIHPVEGLADLLEEIRRRGPAPDGTGRGHRIGLASSAPQVNVDFVLDELRLRAWFDVILSEKDVVQGKPDPAIFLAMSERFGLPPERCLVFEDSLAGIEAAIRAGCRCVALATTHGVASFERNGFLEHLTGVIPNFREFDWDWTL